MPPNATTTNDASLSPTHPSSLSFSPLTWFPLTTSSLVPVRLLCLVPVTRFTTPLPVLSHSPSVAILPPFHLTLFHCALYFPILPVFPHSPAFPRTPRTAPSHPVEVSDPAKRMRDPPGGEGRWGGVQVPCGGHWRVMIGLASSYSSHPHLIPSIFFFLLCAYYVLTLLILPCIFLFFRFSECACFLITFSIFNLRFRF